ncbi:MAG: hypothetical protein HC916_06915 [Coleofasciculaceae cyanobacterium SM2_1_6]|nr:hypothetical protein [Coleofasciculaceae cyanobacterium SM2_1_6]
MTNGNNDHNGSDRIDLLIDQMGILTELVTTGFSELKTISQAQQQEIGRIASAIDKLAETVASQAETTAKQAETTAKQAETTAKQAQTVDRLSLMLERLLSDRT